MNKDELIYEETLTYDNLVNHLLEKYGAVKYSYFCTPTCKSKQSKNSRTKEGLFIHHIMEKEHIKLGDTQYALKWDFDKYQGPDTLVYCNYLEHLLLHIKITEEYMDEQVKKTMEAVGIGGVVNFISPELSSFYDQPPEAGWRVNVFDVIKDNYDDYIRICAKFEKNYPRFDLSKTPNESIQQGKSVKKIRKDIDEYLKQLKEED